jgi:E3 ubiquitin-protein ligase HERC4
MGNFLFFLTGSFKMAYEGFKIYPITINRSYGKDNLPVSHTCFSILDLPDYMNKETL